MIIISIILALREEDMVKSHYFKTSRQASMLVALKVLDEEKYTFLKRKYPDLSLNNFLRNFTFSKKLISSIIEEIKFQEIKDNVIPDFLASDVYSKLKSNKIFRAAYDEVRQAQQKAFNIYLDSCWSRLFI